MAKKLLIIDDDTRNIFALNATLKAKGYECDSSLDGLEGLQKISTDAYGVVLLDMMMPDVDGYEMIPRIRAIKGAEDIPVFAVTAQAMVGDRERCLEAGATEYIAKPIDVDRLLNLLEKYLSH